MGRGKTTEKSMRLYYCHTYPAGAGGNGQKSSGSGIKKAIPRRPSNMLHYETSNRKCFQPVLWWMHTKSGNCAARGHTERVLMFFHPSFIFPGVFGTFFRREIWV